YVLDKTATGMGGRLLRQRLLNPSSDLPEIESRLGAVEELAAKVIVRSNLRKTLESILDLERLLAKITLGSAGPREVLALGRSLAKLPEIVKLTDQLDSPRLRPEFDVVADVRDRILRAISDEAPVNIADGGAIRDGFDAALDELRDISRNSRQYIEVSKVNLHLVPPAYERKQTLANAERFTTPELKELEAKVLSAEERILEI